ncbi:MAG: hypothetical protein NZT92_18125 [Abditibacteriales bacterium]|nr:hypothetical protein [Abditibacteriales bacterium]
MTPRSWSIIICIYLLLSYAAGGDAASPAPSESELPAAWAQRSIALEASPWVRLIDSLSRSLNTPIIASVPPHWEATPWRGRATEVLDAIAQQAKGTWRFAEGCLLFVPDLLAPPAVEKAAAAAGGFPSPLFEFLAGLEDVQLATLAVGQTLPIATLSERQRSVLGRALAPSGGISTEDRTRLLTQGQLRCVLRAGAVLFWRGEELSRAAPEGLFEWREGAVSAARRAGRASDVRLRVGAAQALLGDSPILTLKATAPYTLAQLHRQMQPWWQGTELILSRRVREIPVVLSRGRWQVAKVLALAQVVTHTELRQVGGLLFWEYSGATLNVHRLHRDASECARLYPFYRRLIAALLPAPENALAPFTPEDVLSPALKPYPQLTVVQKNFALERYGLFCLLPPTEVEQRGAEMECFPFAWVQCIFIVPSGEGSSLHFVQWMGPVYNYIWLAHHARQRGRG